MFEEKRLDVDKRAEAAATLDEIQKMSAQKQREALAFMLGTQFGEAKARNGAVIQ